MLSRAQNGTITGKVVYNEEVLPSASVIVGQQSTMSNDRGEFFLSPSPGSYKITVTHSNYQKQAQEVTLKANEP